MARSAAGSAQTRWHRDSSRRLMMGALLVALTMVTAAVIVTTRQSSAVPPSNPFDGWIAVFADGPPNTGEMRLTVAPTIPGAPGANPQVEITLTTCGMGERDVLLLFADDAQLSDVRLAWSSARVGVERHKGLVVSDAAGQDSAPFDVLALRMHLNDLEDCSAVGPMIVAVQLVGRLASDVRRQSTLVGVRSPRAFLAWPAVGWVTGLSPKSLGLFTFSEGIGGQWERPQGSFDVSAGRPALSALVESASPVLEDYRDLHWTSTSPIRPEASVVDLRQGESLQTVALGLSMVFGVLSAVVVQLLVRPSPAREPTASPPPQSVHSTARRRRRGAGLLLVLAWVLGWTLGRGSRRPRQGP